MDRLFRSSFEIANSDALLMPPAPSDGSKAAPLSPTPLSPSAPPNITTAVPQPLLEGARNNRRPSDLAVQRESPSIVGHPLPPRRVPMRATQLIAADSSALCLSWPPGSLLPSPPHTLFFLPGTFLRVLIFLSLNRHFLPPCLLSSLVPRMPCEIPPLILLLVAVASACVMQLTPPGRCLSPSPFLELAAPLHRSLRLAVRMVVGLLWVQMGGPLSSLADLRSAGCSWETSASSQPSLTSNCSWSGSLVTAPLDRPGAQNPNSACALAPAIWWHCRCRLARLGEEGGCAIGGGSWL